MMPPLCPSAFIRHHRLPASYYLREVMIALQEAQTGPATGAVHTVTDPAQTSAGAGGNRVRFALFIKILFKQLYDSGDYLLAARATHLVRTCTRRNRMGDPDFQPLLETLEGRLRDLVGEVHWRRAHAYTRYFLRHSIRGSRDERKKASAMAVPLNLHHDT